MWRLQKLLLLDSRTARYLTIDDNLFNRGEKNDYEKKISAEIVEHENCVVLFCTHRSVFVRDDDFELTDKITAFSYLQFFVRKCSLR